MDNCGILLFEKGSENFKAWVATPHLNYAHEIYVPYFDHPFFNGLMRAKKRRTKTFLTKLSQSENKNWYQYLLKHTILRELMPPERRKAVRNTKGQI
ncbi:hypothetical protein MJD09_15110, partial [bacterium]|nr:hypothetical protein [bacterium]